MSIRLSAEHFEKHIYAYITYGVVDAMNLSRSNNKFFDFAD